MNQHDEDYLISLTKPPSRKASQAMKNLGIKPPYKKFFTARLYFSLGVLCPMFTLLLWSISTLTGGSLSFLTVHLALYLAFLLVQAYEVTK